MSGGGGSGDWRTGGGDGQHDCNIVEKTAVNSPRAGVLATLTRGDALTVQLRDQGARKTLVAVAASGEVAGSLTPRQLLTLIECIEQGNAYEAHVLDVRGGLCEVELRSRP
jgi:hypothetical protein